MNKQNFIIEKDINAEKLEREIKEAFPRTKNIRFYEIKQKNIIELILKTEGSKEDISVIIDNHTPES